MESYLRTYCEINLDAILQNMLNIREKAGKDVKLMAVIKADGYGHGAKEIGHYIKDKVDSYVCYEKITNRALMRQYFAPDNDLLIYTTAVAAPPQTLLRNCGYKVAG